MLKRNFLCFILVLLGVIFIARELNYISQKSATYDEAYFIAQGWATLKTGDYRLRKDKTFLVPFITAIPLSLSSQMEFPLKDNPYWKEAEKERRSWSFGLDFLYHNSLTADTILYRARLPIIFLSVILMFFVFKLTKEIYGELPAIISVFLYSFSPTILAHSGLSTEDITLTCFVFITIYTFWRYTNFPKTINAIFLGIALGLALNSKHSALILIPGLIILCWFYRKNINFKYQHLIYFLIGLIIPFLLIYQIFHIKEYFLSLKETTDYINRSQMSFLMGKYSIRGFREYFLIAFLIKTPVAVLIFFLLRLITQRVSKTDFLLIFPILLFFIPASFTPMQIGHRHILPIYPFLFVFISSGIANFLHPLLKDRKVLPVIIASLLLLHFAYSSIKIHPHYLAYFNEFIGGPENGYKYLVDSNIDWGQDLKGLRKYIQKNAVSDVILSYYGSGVPDKAGFEFQDMYSFGLWGRKDHINPPHPKKEILAVSVTNIQGLYLGKIGHDVFYWLKDKEMIDNIGHSIFIYDVTEEVASHERLLHIYFWTGQYDKAIREAGRILILDPTDSFAHLILSFIYMNTNRLAKALNEYREAVRLNSKLSFPYDELITHRASQNAYGNAFNNMKHLCLEDKLTKYAEIADYWATVIAGSK